jgi:AcrR family transcriptional regulator
MSSSVVTALTYEAVLAQLDAFIGPIEGGDARARRRLHILRVATEMFARQGYRKTSMDEVAQRAGVAKGTLYTYYATKNELLFAAVALEKREHMGEVVVLMDPERPAAERLREWVKAILLMPIRMPLTAALLRGDQEMAAVMAEAPTGLNAQIEANRADFLGDLVDEAARPHSWTPSELRDRAAVLGGLAYLSTHLQAEHVRGGVSMERFADILADTLVAGLRGASSTNSKERGTEP